MKVRFARRRGVKKLRFDPRFWNERASDVDNLHFLHTTSFLDDRETRISILHSSAIERLVPGDGRCAVSDRQIDPRKVAHDIYSIPGRLFSRNRSTSRRVITFAFVITRRHKGKSKYASAPIMTSMPLGTVALSLERVPLNHDLLVSLLIMLYESSIG